MLVPDTFSSFQILVKKQDYISYQILSAVRVWHCMLRHELHLMRGEGEPEGERKVYWKKGRMKNENEEHHIRKKGIEKEKKIKEEYYEGWHFKTFYLQISDRKI